MLVVLIPSHYSVGGNRVAVCGPLLPLGAAGNHKSSTDAASAMRCSGLRTRHSGLSRRQLHGDAEIRQLPLVDR